MRYRWNDGPVLLLTHVAQNHAAGRGGKPRVFARVVTRPEGTAQRRDFAATGGVSETEPGILKGGGDRPPLRPVWVAAQGLDLKASLNGNPCS